MSVDEVTQAFLSTANRYVPMSNGHLPRKRVPWWNQDIRIAIKDKKKSTK